MYIKHIPCPNCGSRDNRAVYSDGSEFCFGCRAFTPAKVTLDSIRRKQKENESALHGEGYGIPLPHGFSSPFIHPAAMQWLTKYEITDKEIEDYGIGYCSDGIVLPCFGDDGIRTIVGYVIRKNSGPRKYETRGSRVDLSMCMLKNQREDLPLFFVEDYLSSIKVSRVYPCVPLFGASIALDLVTRLSERFKSFRVWLDPDKRKSSVEQCLKLRQYGFDISPVFSDKDPKEYSEIEIKRIATQ